MSEIHYVLDLEKSWREEMHPRDKYGKFSTVRAGSRVVTSSGQSGIIQESDDTHHKIRYDSGKMGKVKKDNVIHEKDHQKVVAQQKKEAAAAKRAATKAAKEKVQRAADKANASGAAGKPKRVKVSTSEDKSAAKKPAAKKEAPAAKKPAAKKEAPAAKTAAKKEAPAAKKPAAKKEAPAVKKPAAKKEAPAVKKPAAKKEAPTAKKPAAKKAEPKPVTTTPEKPALVVSSTSEPVQATAGIDAAWQSPQVQKILKLAPAKRKPEDIQRIAGEITSANDKFARYAALRVGRAFGMNVGADMQTVGGQRQETGTYGDLLQTARMAMMETLTGMLAGTSTLPRSMSAIVMQRMKQKLGRYQHDNVNQIATPHKMRSAVMAVKSGEQELAQTLGRTPTHDELAQHLHTHSPEFKNAQIVEKPQWDAKSGDWIASRKMVTDPKEKLRTLQEYVNQQKADSLSDMNMDRIQEARGTKSVEDDYTDRERQSELREALPKAMSDMGLNEDEIRVLAVKFSSASSSTSKPSMTSQEVADHLNEHYGMDVNKTWVDNRTSKAMAKLMKARENNHPALAQLQMFKSLLSGAILRALYQYDLVKSIAAWGAVPSEVLQTSVRYTRFARNRDELVKSLAPHEMLDSALTLDNGKVIGQVAEYVLPDDAELKKALLQGEQLQKSMFPHVGGSNSQINDKASQYVKANGKKYGNMSAQQHASAKKKTGALTWSEELLLKNPGSAWISWGGKRILVNSGSGEIIYDSKNDTHREDHNAGAQEDKVEFHHEQEEGHEDEGVKAFKEDFMQKHRDEWIQKDGKSIVGGVKGDFLKNHAHKALDAYKDLSDEHRAKLDAFGADKDAKAEFLGEHFLNKDGTKDVLRKFKNGELTEDEAREHLAGIGSVAGRNAKMMTSLLKDVQKHDLDSEDGHKAVAASLGAKEMTRANEEANKNLLPEGHYMIGNPKTGKTMMVHVGGSFTGGRGSRKKDEDGNEESGKYTSEVMEAFDPDGRVHEQINTWGDLGRALGYTGKEASDLKKTLVSHANTEADKPFMKKVEEEEFNKHRAKTKAGMQATMLHKNFALVDQARSKDGSISRQVFAQKMPDGTVNHITVDGDGQITDPLMQRLLNQRAPVTNAGELNELLKNAIGNRTWVTAHFGSDIHIGDALGHHVQLEYDGNGAPKVVGGQYDGYRYTDQSDVKGAIDPATGEPVKALFKNGKLVDRRFTRQNDVPIKPGNPVMYKDGDRYRKGRVHSEQDGAYKITDGDGHVIGMFKKEELKPAKAEGRILSDAGTVAVHEAKTGTHRMNVAEAFAGESPKAQALLAEALRKAKVNSAFDRDGNLHKELELSDAMHKRLEKVLGRSKAGREVLNRFNSAYTTGLELHVPEALRKHVEAEGVRVLADGTAKISAGKFEQLRDSFTSGNIGGLSLTHDAQRHLKDHFDRKDRKPLLAKRSEDFKQLQNKYQPSTVSTGDKKFDEHYKAQFKDSSYLMNPEQGLYGTQLEGVNHLVSRGRGIAGHGMGTGKTILGVVAGLHDKAQSLAKGEKPKKTLIVAPKGIMSDWGKEIASHTNSKGLYIGGGSSFKGSKNIDGKKVWGQDGTEQEAADIRKFKKGEYDDGDHDFHIVSYDTFMRNREHFANSGQYGNIVIDEVHAFKNQKGKRGTALAETTDKFKNVWGLSGTPMENDAREMHALVDTITGGKHPLGNLREFQNDYMLKDKNGKLIGVKPEKAEQLGDILANVVQFRGGEDVVRNDGSKVEFPHLVGAESKDGRPPQVDFIGDMSDGSRDHKTTAYYGTKHSITDFDTEEKEVTNTKNGEKYTVQTTKPVHVDPETAAMLGKYKELEARFLPESKLNELATASATGLDQGQKGSQNYLTGMQKLQKYLNAPLSHKMYVGGGDALDSDVTGAQAEKPGKTKAKGLSEGEHYKVDENGFKRYYESDGSGGYKKNPDGSPVLLPPLHKNNPKAQYLQDRIHKYLDGLQQENKRRVERGQVPLVPKLVVKSSYTTFGTDIVDNVLKEVQQQHPIFHDLQQQGFGSLERGQFTGENTDREQTKTGFRGNKHNYAKNQGNMWATTVSPAGKEGVDFGNAHVMFHYDQDWNPQKMAQFTARVRRSDSDKTHNQMGRANAVRVESLHVPNTVEDFMFNAQDTKMNAIQHVVDNTRNAETLPKLGETQGSTGYGHRGFTSRKNPARKPAASGGELMELPKEKPTAAESPALPKRERKVADKAIKLVILL